MLFLTQAIISTRGNNLTTVTFGLSCSHQNFLRHFQMFSFLFFIGLHLNSREAYIMLRLRYRWGQSDHLGIVHSFFQHLLRYAPPLTHYQSSPIYFYCGVWVSMWSLVLQTNPASCLSLHKACSGLLVYICSNFKMVENQRRLSQASLSRHPSQPFLDKCPLALEARELW